MSEGKILILEPKARLRLLGTQALSREGYSVTAVASIEEAAKAASQEHYQLLIISSQEPEPVERLLSHLPPETAVLIITTRELLAQMVEQVGTGIHSFLIQPFNRDKLMEKVAEALSQARWIEECFRTRTLMTLEQTNRLLISQDETEQFFKLIVEMSINGTGADYASLAVKDEASAHLVIKAEQGAPKPAWRRICRQVARLGQPSLIQGSAKGHPHLRQLMAEAGVSAVLGIPLVIKGEVVGSLNLIKQTRSQPFTSSDLHFASILGWWSSITLENARLMSKVQEQRRHVEALLHEISLAQENERRRVAIQIHDGVAQWMVGACYGIKALSTLISESRLAELEAELAKIEHTLQRSVTELRRTIANLRPLPLEEVGLTEAIRHAAAQLSEAGITAHIEVDEELPELSFAEETTTYWIVQEILTNIRNHSRATEVWLRLRSQNGSLLLEVSDNGQGFDPDEVMSNTITLEHMGLTGMQERARLLGGQLTIRSKPGEGTVVTFTFPVSSQLAMKTTI